MPVGANFDYYPAIISTITVTPRASARLHEEMLTHNVGNMDEPRPLKTPNNSKKHRVWVLVLLVRTSGTLLNLTCANQAQFSVLQQNRTIYSNSIYNVDLRHAAA